MGYSWFRWSYHSPAKVSLMRVTKARQWIHRVIKYNNDKVYSYILDVLLCPTVNNQVSGGRRFRWNIVFLWLSSCSGASDFSLGQAMAVSLEVVYLCYCLVCVAVSIMMTVLAGAALRSTKSQVRTHTPSREVPLSIKHWTDMLFSSP